jgi:Holliday junction resolvasome RuvABC endonuclease subunit
MRVLGVDPGIAGGALAILEIEVNTATVLAAIDVPTLGIKAKHRVDTIAVQEFLLKHRPEHCFIERASAFPKQGVALVFKYGAAVGALYAVITLCAIPLSVVSPAEWKRGMRLQGKDKENARLLATELLPSARPFLALHKDHNKAEACLIALFGTRSQLIVTAPAAISEFTGKTAS